ncbi:Os03g0651950 [Oryza sativa Japonica Group]|uniref:Os03g0651950 protein n=1 Tax=Oryza sativa subsp. japonica TaxID=39947 RepID=A0A0P0W1J7_ORYSJ|nr:hypothetical protein EE612_019324 [Oryza sativa]BAS85525.1 Os03g0651950 [Oryza sativa Japonica Group]
MRGSSGLPYACISVSHDGQVNRMASSSSPILRTPTGCTAVSAKVLAYTRLASSVERRMRSLPMRASLGSFPASPLASALLYRTLSNTAMVSTVQGSNTSHAYCSFHRGLNWSRMVRVRAHLGPYLSTTYASVDPLAPSLAIFIGTRFAAPRMPTSSIPTGGFDSCFDAARTSLATFAASSSTW